ncbi:MAG TPA: TonB-dependent receptor [Blastocatellia bacterium]|nr:TonB-dependent receptor [Blastocatellia bacterium]
MVLSAGSVIIFTLLMALGAQSPSPPSGGTLRGFVADPSGSAVVSAQVTVTDAHRRMRQTVRTNSEGRFTLPLPAGENYELRITADGFVEHVQRVTLAENETISLSITLAIAPLTETLVVTPGRTEQKLGDIPAPVTSLARGAVESSPALVVDDLLRQVPTFSLFRRSSSLASHPTTQGVSLRGIGPSGVSRTLVLLDNAPYNDPFGGWVAWSGIPLETVERVEIVPGSGSHLYGTYAYGGVINILTRAPERRSWRLTTQFGTQETGTLDGGFSDVFGRFAFSLGGSYVSTDGYPVVARAERGAIDTTATARYGTARLTLEYARSRVRLFLRGHLLDEHRRNGTHLQRNSTVAKFLTGGIIGDTAGGSHWQILTFAHLKAFHSTFTEIASDRSRERITLFQRVPTNSVGSSFLWSRRMAHRHLLTAGTDLRWIEGQSQELVPSATGIVVRRRVAGGTQWLGGFFFQDQVMATERLTITLTGRFDHWRNTDALSRETVLASGDSTETRFPVKSNSLVSPRVGVLYRVTDRWSLWGAASGGFRAPTLNELYRQFRVGNVVTLANDQLGPERLLGGEGGIRYAPADNLLFRLTGFWNRITGSISNATLSVTPTLITQKRQNLGRTRIRGLEADIEYRPTTRWRWTAAYLYDDATIREFPANPLIEGNRIPQVPAHRFSIQAQYTHPSRLSIFWQGRFVSRQFDDDRNQFALERFFLADLSLSRSWSQGIDLFVNVENLFNTTYAVGKTPFTTVGAPRRIRLGIRLSLAPR